jgi:hypothetical protein
MVLVVPTRLYMIWASSIPGDYAPATGSRSAARGGAMPGYSADPSSACGGVLALAEAEAVIGVLFRPFPISSRVSWPVNRVHALDALGGVAVGDGADLKRVHFGEIRHLIEGQGGIVDQPPAVAFGISGALLGKISLALRPPLWRRSRGHR